MKINIYIDGNNLYRGAKALGYEINYMKFGVWLRQKYNANKIYLFIGFVGHKEPFYKHLEHCGYILVFKQTISFGGITKGNCDAELVLKVVTDFYTDNLNTCIIVTGDGDFGCLVEFLKESKVSNHLIVPDKNRCSILLKNKYVKMTFLNDHYHKFSKSV